MLVWAEMLRYGQGVSDTDFNSRGKTLENVKIRALDLLPKTEHIHVQSGLGSTVDGATSHWDKSQAGCDDEVRFDPLGRRLGRKKVGHEVGRKVDVGSL